MADLTVSPEAEEVIYFQPAANGVRIVRVLHGARDHEGLL